MPGVFHKVTADHTFATNTIYQYAIQYIHIACIGNYALYSMLANIPKMHMCIP